MIDIENELLTVIDDALDCNVAKEYMPFSEKFPLVTFMCIDNSVNQRLRTGEHLENYADMTFEVNAYSNSEEGRLTEAKTLIKQVDEILGHMGLARTFFRQTPNIDENVVRVTAQYQCRTDGKNIYRR